MDAEKAGLARIRDCLNDLCGKAGEAAGLAKQLIQSPEVFEGFRRELCRIMEIVDGKLFVCLPSWTRGIPAPAQPVETNTAHAVLGEGIHDATLFLVDFVLDERLTLGLRDRDDQRRYFYLNSVQKVGFRDFIEGMIVSDIFVWPIGTAESKSIDIAVWRTLLSERVAESGLHHALTALTDKYRGQQLVYVESSYGGSIAAICATLEHRRIDAPA